MNFLDTIRESDAETFTGVGEQEVIQAETELGMKFPETYRAILREFGSVEIDSDEIFGLGVEGYLNVVETTLKEREMAEGKLDHYIVLQNIGIEGILIVVDEQDRVYEYRLGEFRDMLSSTADYVTSLLG
ncbi:hypothetical protein EVJ33_14775 [Exiguobacterium sp. SL-10]|uniref:SMI1/KNR4 family protein n=1 Tax=Exiguobacterium sp. SL-10 TaxID=2510962 RepID=UPI00103875C2|nr:SMI1/KNR4 family protein [Exiguobacterium sp. SL-10]TCI28226.1 hypothetical protein EVJ33_14775 [Exiguobacterium sp. SL-10]